MEIEYDMKKISIGLFIHVVNFEEKGYEKKLKVRYFG